MPIGADSASPAGMTTKMPLGASPASIRMRRTTTVPLSLFPSEVRAHMSEASVWRSLDCSLSAFAVGEIHLAIFQLEREVARILIIMMSAVAFLMWMAALARSLLLAA